MLTGNLCYRIRQAWAKALLDNWEGEWSALPGRTGIRIGGFQ